MKPKTPLICVAVSILQVSVCFIEIFRTKLGGKKVFRQFFSFFSSFSSAPNGTLKIFTVQEGDEGSYQCVAENDKDMSVASGSLLLGGRTTTTKA